MLLDSALPFGTLKHQYSLIKSHMTVVWFNYKSHCTVTDRDTEGGVNHTIQKYSCEFSQFINAM